MKQYWSCTDSGAAILARLWSFRQESWWLFVNGRCKCCKVLGVGLCWVIASGPGGYQVKATKWQAGWWFAPENEKVITVSAWVKYWTVLGEMEDTWEWNYDKKGLFLGVFYSQITFYSFMLFSLKNILSLISEKSFEKKKLHLYTFHLEITRAFHKEIQRNGK